MARNFSMLEKSSEVLSKFLRTKPHKNCCIRLVLTRAEHLAPMFKNFPFDEEMFCHNDVTISTQIASENASSIHPI